MATPKPKIVLTFEALASAVPLANRVRMLLKTALRRDGLKCVKIDGDAFSGSPENDERQQKSRPAHGSPRSAASSGSTIDYTL
jgi:hypothetical protein